MKVLITGSNGFIGGALLEYLIEANFEVVGLSRDEDLGSKEHHSRFIIKNFQDLTTEDLGKFDVIVHLAATGVSPRSATWEECMKVNFLDVITLVEKSFASGVKKIIIAGTFAEFGKTADKVEFLRTDDLLLPDGPYATSKALLGLSLKNMNIPEGNNIIYIRLFSVFGEKQNASNLFPQIRDCAISGKDLETTLGEQVRDFIHINDVCFKIKEILQLSIKEKLTYANIGSGTGTSLREFINFWWDKFEATGVVKYGSLPYRHNEKMRFVSDQNEPILLSSDF